MDLLDLKLYVSNFGDLEFYQKREKNVFLSFTEESQSISLITSNFIKKFKFFCFEKYFQKEQINDEFEFLNFSEKSNPAPKRNSKEEKENRQINEMKKTKVGLVN